MLCSSFSSIIGIDSELLQFVGSNAFGLLPELLDVYIVSWNNSLPISIRRISLVPAPIS